MAKLRGNYILVFLSNKEDGIRGKWPKLSPPTPHMHIMK